MSAYIIGIGAGIVIIFIVRLMWKENNFVIMKAKFEGYKRHTETKWRTLPSITVKNIDTGERETFSLLIFEKILWESIYKYDFTDITFIFCMNKFSKKYGTVFAASLIGHQKYAFYGDLKPPHSIMKISFNFFVRYIAAYILYYMYIEFSKSTNMLLEALPIFLFTLVVYSTYSYIKSLTQQKAIFQQKLDLVEKAGIQKPLK